MEQHNPTPPLVHLAQRPGEAYDILQVNVPIPRAVVKSPAAEHLSAAGRELGMAIQALIEQFMKSGPTQQTPQSSLEDTTSPSSHVRIPISGAPQS